jgi:hydroxyacylglutathione hydrolase
MFIEQMYTACLAEAAYYIESQGEAIIIDPLRETAPYLKLLAERKSKLKYIIETHFHADFVSGHLDLARETGAKIIYGPTAEPAFAAIVATDGQKFELGTLQIEVLHTPGHTLESSCFLLYNESGEPHAIFTGDTFFINEVGRPDLAVKSDVSERDLAEMLYHSIQNKIAPLPDQVLVYPGHGPGSLCGKSIGKETMSTIGEQRKTNYALGPIDKDRFIEITLDGLHEVARPAYFFKDAVVNKTGYEAVDVVVKRGLQPLTPAEAVAAIEAGAIVLDTRDPDAFAAEHLPNAVNIGLDGTFAVWVGTVLEMGQPLVIVAPEGREEESVVRLARIGYDSVQGILQGGISAWKSAGMPTASIREVEPEHFMAELKSDVAGEILDVRRVNEFNAGNIDGALSLPLDLIPNQIQSLEPSKHYFVHCAGGYRSMIAASLMKRAGISNVTNVRKGFSALKDIYPAQVVIPAPVLG